MKKNIIYIFASVLTFSIGFISCTNNDYEESLNTEMSNSRMTRAMYNVTYDDIQAKVDELDKKYGIGSTIINREQPISIFNDRFFLNLENMMRKELGLEPLEKSSIKSFGTYTLWDDSSIDKIAVASTTDDKEAGEPLAPINFDGDYTLFNTGFRHEDISTSTIISAFNRYYYDITYHIKYSSSVGNNNVTFVDFSDETNYIRANIYDNWLIQSSYTNTNNISNEDMEDLMNTYKLTYVENSFSYLGNILQNDEETNLNPGAESLLFDYYFDMKIGDIKIRALMNHPSGIISYYRLNK